MYLAFYGLKEKPFNPTPDPRFVYMSPAHKDALAQLLYGVQERRGFIVLTGKVGTGKTTMLQMLRQRLNGRVAISSVVHSTMSFDGILEYALQDFGIAKGEQSRAQRLIALNNFLMERERSGQNSVLVLDEAQNLAPSTLEEIRLLSNFETPTNKLLQILLVGQPELKAKLQLPELHQLKERIGLRCQIPPLTPEDTRQYIRTRLRIAGAPDLGLFTEPALGRITEYSGGIPRRINILCDHCLLFGYADQARRIDKHTVDEAIRYLEDGIPRRRRAGRPHRLTAQLVCRWGLWTLAAALTGTVVGLALKLDLTFPDLVQLMRTIPHP